MITKGDARHAARLGAVQALYQMEMAGAGPKRWRRFAEHRFGELPVPPDGALFVAIVNGVPGSSGGNRPRHRRRLVGKMEAGTRWIPFCAPFCAARCSSLWRAAMCPPGGNRRICRGVGRFFGGDNPASSMAP
jgi:hypothetical protein